MKVALVTTTINVPRVLALYRKHGPDVKFFVVADQKTPEEAINFCAHDIGNTNVIYLQDQEKWQCSKLIGWNCIQRRNIGFLEALKWGAELIVSIDDDNIPLNTDYFDALIKHFEVDAVAVDYIGRSSPLKWKDVRFSGLQASAASGWFDVGALLYPHAEHRGFPHAKRAQPIFESVTQAKIGAVAGICLGDPDIGAATRIANGPTVHGVSEILRSGVVVAPDTWTVFNSQNTAVIRELIPAWFMFPQCGRYDDIYASLIVQRVMREKNLHVHFGKPFVWQQRNQHDLIKDLKAEIDGMEHVVHLAGILDDMRFFADEHPARTIFKKLATIEWFPKRASEAALAWMDDIDQVMK